MKNSVILRIITAWIVVGTLDILAAFLQYFVQTGKNPLIIGNYIASGLFGDKAFGEGTMMTILGFVFHYFIAFVFTFFYFTFFSKLPFFENRRILSGISYGIFIWFVMRLIILPLSHVPSLEFHIAEQLLAVFILIVCIGIPLAFMTGQKRKIGQSA